MNNKVINVRVEYESAPIRNIAVQCPYCDNWFSGWDLCSFDDLRYKHDIPYIHIQCPICNNLYGFMHNVTKNEMMNFNIEILSGSDEIYKDCKKQKTEWV